MKTTRNISAKTPNGDSNLNFNISNITGFLMARGSGAGPTVSLTQDSYPVSIPLNVKNDYLSGELISKLTPQNLYSNSALPEQRKQYGGIVSGFALAGYDKISHLVYAGAGGGAPSPDDSYYLDFSADSLYFVSNTQTGPFNSFTLQYVDSTNNTVTISAMSSMIIMVNTHTSISFTGAHVTTVGQFCNSSPTTINARIYGLSGTYIVRRMLL